MQIKSIYKILVFFLSIFILFALSISHAKSENYSQQTKINWQTYSKSAFAEAKKKNKPLYIFIYSDSCSWCRKFEKETLEKKVIREIIQSNFVPVLVNQKTQPELARQLGVKLIPANLLITADRKKLVRFYGFLIVGGTEKYPRKILVMNKLVVQYHKENMLLKIEL